MDRPDRTRHHYVGALRALTPFALAAKAGAGPIRRNDNEPRLASRLRGNARNLKRRYILPPYSMPIYRLG